MTVKWQQWDQSLTRKIKFPMEKYPQKLKDDYNYLLFFLIHQCLFSLLLYHICLLSWSCCSWTSYANLIFLSINKRYYNILTRTLALNLKQKFTSIINDTFLFLFFLQETCNAHAIQISQDPERVIIYRRRIKIQICNVKSRMWKSDECAVARCNWNHCSLENCHLLSTVCCRVRCILRSLF